MNRFDLDQDDLIREYAAEGPYVLAEEALAEIVKRDARIQQLESLLLRVIEWTHSFPVEASLADEIVKAISD